MGMDVKKSKNIKFFNSPVNIVSKCIALCMISYYNVKATYVVRLQLTYYILRILITSYLKLILVRLL